MGDWGRMINKRKIKDTYAEVSEGLYCRVVVTADSEEMLKKAAQDATATPSAVVGRIDSGIERWLNEEDTPDSRKGAILQFWKVLDARKPLAELVNRFEKELSYKIRQDVLVKPFTAIFDALFSEREGEFDMMERIGHCGDGFEWEEQIYERNMIVVPIMVPDFLIERYIGYARGVTGGNFWYMCRTKNAVTNAGKKALEAISQVEGVVTPFGICAAGSKPETRFPQIGPTTNHPYCPSLKQRLGDLSKVPENVNFIPEIVINGISVQAVKDAMKAGIEAVLTFDDVVKISAGNYGGKLGESKIHLLELFS